MKYCSMKCSLENHQCPRCKAGVGANIEGADTEPVADLGTLTTSVQDELPNNTPSEQPASQQASPSPSRQSLEAGISKIPLETVTKENGSIWLSDKDVAALLKTVDRYVEERERLARVDETKWWMSNAHRVKNLSIATAARLVALRQQIKGES